MPYIAQRIDSLIDLLVEAMLRELDSEQENADESGQEQRRRGDQANAILHDDFTTANRSRRKAPLRTLQAVAETDKRVGSLVRRM
jgi:hypothetical protein